MRPERTVRSDNYGGLIRPAARAELAELAETLSSAFIDDPVFCWWLEAAGSERRHILRSWFENQLDTFLCLDGCFTTPDLVGVALWAPPGCVEAAGCSEPAADAGAFALYRDRGDILKAIEVKSRPTTPHLYLADLGVRQEYRGRGVGSALLGAGIQRFQQAGVPAVLLATGELTRGLYRRHGFDDQAEYALPRGPKVWAMNRASNRGN
jgi:ribosomal protein S18 acetylase RimI-like enzyme